MAELSVREVAGLLGVPEKRIWRWVGENAIPHYRLRDDVRFNRVELQEWAHARGEVVRPEGAGGSPQLADAIARGGIAREVPGGSRAEVLAAVAALPGVPAGVDRARLAELLVARERLASTGLGGGVAAPHPRDPLVVAVGAPTVVVALLARPVDFGAADGRPVETVALVLSPTVNDHLATLARLAFALRDGELRALLAARAPDAAILGRLRALEARLGTPPPPPPEEDDG